MARIMTLMFFLNLSWMLPGQEVCEGSLGNNIFTGGEFGSGISNILQENPGIAPGYIYTTSTPPSDGYYTITNNTGRWSGLYPTWLEIEDNSSDPNGYMMVVNASFEPGIFYEEVITGLCENTFYEFSADIINMIKIGTPDHIDPNVDFLLDDQVMYSTGNISKTEKWNKYGFTFTTDETQSEIKLTLRNNAPGGIGNDLALDNISFRPCGPKSFIDLNAEETIFLCVEGEPLTIDADIVGATGQEFSLFWQQSEDGVNWTDLGVLNQKSINHDIFEPGDYYYRYISAANDVNLNNDKCRIISDVLNIQVLPRFYFFSDSLCNGSIYDFNGRGLSTTGIYTDTVTSSFGCDSVIILDLTVVPELPIDIELNISDPTCFEYEDGHIIGESIIGGYGGYMYSLDGQQGSNEFLSLSSGEYQFKAVDKYGCFIQVPIMLVDPEKFTISIGEDLELKLGESLSIDPITNFSIERILWSPADIFSCPTCIQTTTTPLKDGYLTVKAWNINECEASDSILVKVNKEESVFIPNIFSPNDDGVNDLFELKAVGSSATRINKFLVLNRWGDIVYKQENFNVNDYSLYWDGRVDTNPVASGVYTYIIEIDFIDGTTGSLTGDITIIR